MPDGSRPEFFGNYPVNDDILRVMSPPRSVRLKLGRVEEHMMALDKAIRDFLETEPYAATRELERAGADHIIVWERYTEAPESFGLIAGDAIHNLRSSLDHMAVALAVAGATAKGITMTAEEEARIQFPIVATHQQFANQLNGSRLLHVDPAAQAFIEARQPYNSNPGAPKMAPLSIVSDLDNADKHRALTVAGLSPAIVKFNWPAELNKIPMEPAAPPELREPGAEIGRFRFPSPQGEMDVPVEYHWRFALWTGLYWPIHDIWNTLRQYIGVVNFTINILGDRFL